MAAGLLSLSRFSPLLAKQKQPKLVEFPNTNHGYYKLGVKTFNDGLKHTYSSGRETLISLPGFTTIRAMVAGIARHQRALGSGRTTILAIIFDNPN